MHHSIRAAPQKAIRACFASIAEHDATEQLHNLPTMPASNCDQQDDSHKQRHHMHAPMHSSRGWGQAAHIVPAAAQLKAATAAGSLARLRTSVTAAQMCSVSVRHLILG